jgi:hypothetical protein
MTTFRMVFTTRADCLIGLFGSVIGKDFFKKQVNATKQVLDKSRYHTFNIDNLQP